MDKGVTITVDGQTLQVPEGVLLWEACQQHGIDIPIFCYHTKLGPVGACRTCLVEMEGARGPITACSTPVSDGMVVRTKSPAVEQMQRGIFEFLLLNHPLDCPICDRGGECPLQDQVFAYGPGQSRYIEPKRHHVKPIPLGPTIALDRERCVLCWRCVRFTAEIAEDKSIVLLDRGDHTVVGTFQDQPYVSQFSGNVIELCPVGALTSRKQRFNFRPWELQNRPSVCPHCAFGCNINVSVRKNDEVIRFLSRDNPDLDDSWLCDRGRFGFEFINSPDRLKSPLIRRGEAYQEVSWDEALSYIADRVTTLLTDEDAGPGTLAGIASPRLTNEDLFTFKRFMNESLGSQRIDHFPRPTLVLDPDGEAAMHRLTRTAVPITRLLSSSTILLLGANPSEREPVMELRIRQAINKHGAQLVIMQSDEIPLSSKATRTLRIPPGALTAGVRELTDALRAGGGQLSRDVEGLFSGGQVTVVYDDTFPGAEDKASALQAVDALVETLGTRGEVGTLPLLDAANSMGARDLGVLPGGRWDEPVVDLIRGGGLRAAFLLGVDVARDVTDEAFLHQLAALDLVVLTELFPTETARFAHVILPAASFAERAGTFTNSEGRVQVLTQAVPPPGIALPEWQILADLSQYLPSHLEYALPQDIWKDIARSVARYNGVTYQSLGERGHIATALQPV